MGCVNCKKLHGGSSAEVPPSRTVALHYLQQQKGPPAESPFKGSGSRAGSETQQGAAEASMSPVDTPVAFHSPALSVTGAEGGAKLECVEVATIENDPAGSKQTARKGSILKQACPLVGWPEELPPEGETISTAAQLESLEEWLRGDHTPQQEQEQQKQGQGKQQKRTKQNEMIVPMRSNDFYGYRRASRSYPPSRNKEQQQQQPQQQGQDQQSRDRRELSVETLSCVRRGFDACVLRDARAAEIELNKAENLYAALCNDVDPTAAAAIAMRRLSRGSSFEWSGATSNSRSGGNRSRGSRSKYESIEIDLDKRIQNLRATLRDMQEGYMAAEARRSLFSHSPKVSVSPGGGAAAVAAAAAERHMALVPSPRTNNR